MTNGLIDSAVNQAATEISQLLATQRGQTIDTAQANAYRVQLATAIATYQNRRQQLRDVYGAIATTQNQLAQARDEGRESDIASWETTLQTHWQARLTALAEQEAAARAVLDQQQQLVEGLGTAGAFTHLAGDIPIVLLPVRLETRYFADDEEHYELRVRIFPDEVHIDHHQPMMSQEELDETQQYWNERLADGPDSDGAILIWQSLCEQVGDDRAAWLVGALDPFGRGGRYETGDSRETAPPFPTVEIAPDGWIEPAQARALPDRWVIVGYYRQQRVLLHWTDPIPTELSVTPAMGAPGAEFIDQGDSAPDEGLEWMTDFQAAEAVGMAARIRLSKILARSMTHLLVFGVNAAQPLATATEEWQSLLAAHSATGLDFLAAGSPTNNTQGLKTDYREKSHEHLSSHRRLLTNHPDSTAQTNAVKTAQALGIEPQVFRYAKRSQDPRPDYTQAAYAALWPTTWERFLKDHLPIDVSAATLTFAYTHFVNYVRSGGLLPCLRIQSQPYGLLPILPLQDWQAEQPSPQETTFVNGMRSLLGNDTSYQGLRGDLANSSDPQQSLLTILSLMPQPVFEYESRLELQTSNVDDNLRSWWEDLLSQLSAGAIDFYDYYRWSTLWRGRTYLRGSTDITWPLVAVQADKTRPLADNFIAAMANQPTLAAIENHQLPGVEDPEHRSLLYRLLRQAYLKVANDPEGDLTAFQAHLTTLQDLPVETLENLFNEVMGDCTYRIDSWLSSVANRRLDEVRANRPTGIQIGGFGWLGGLQPPGEGAQEDIIRDDPDSAGYIHMSSLSQGKTAAILHGGYLSHIDQAAGGTLTLELSSQRVKFARSLLEGIRQGQSLGALLGFQFERMIQGEFGEHIPALRAYAPLTLGDAASNGSGLAQTNVVDGLLLHRLWREEETFQSAISAIDPELATKYDQIDQTLQIIDNGLDALSDLLIAEGVHQATNGNAARAAAAFDLIADGTGRVDETEITATPVSGQQVGHRVAILLPGQSPVAWPGDETRLRAIAENHLNRWAATILGPPEQIRFRATFTPEADPSSPVQRNYAIADFDLCALDLVYYAAPYAETAPLVELLRLYLTGQGPEGTGFAGTVTIDSERNASFEATERSLAEAIALAHGLKQTFAESRPLQPTDCQEVPSDGDAELEESSLIDLETRAQDTQAQFAQHLTHLASQSENLDRWWQAAVIVGPVDPTLADAAAGMLTDLHQRQTAYDAIAPETPPLARQQGAIAKIKALLGQDFQVLSRFTLPQPEVLAAAFAAQNRLLEGDLSKPKRWLQDYARVRPSAEALDLLLTLGALFEQATALKVAQLPVMPDALWIGEQLSASGIAPRLSFVFHTPYAMDLGQELTGLLVDSWSEMVPNDHALTGLTFHYDEPKAQAPQSLLLVVPPDPTQGWEFETLETALLQTLTFVHERRIDPATVLDYNNDNSRDRAFGYLPTIYLDEESA